MLDKRTEEGLDSLAYLSGRRPRKHEERQGT